jgi:hypothetical protein
MTASRAVARVLASGLLVLGASTDGQASPPDVDRTSRGNPMWAVPLHTLAATRDRPIFSPSRRPPSPAAVAAAPPLAPPTSAKPPEPDRPRLSILGTVVSRRDAIGVFMEDANKNVLRLHPGQDYAGWVLRAVKRRQVNLEKGNAVATLSLPAPGEAQPAAPTASLLSSEKQGGNSAPGAAAQIASSPATPPDRRRRD